MTSPSEGTDLAAEVAKLKAQLEAADLVNKEWRAEVDRLRAAHRLTSVAFKQLRSFASGIYLGSQHMVEADNQEIVEKGQVLLEQTMQILSAATKVEPALLYGCWDVPTLREHGTDEQKSSHQEGRLMVDKFLKEVGLGPRGAFF